MRAQHEIPLRKALALCVKGLSHRMLRSLLTLAVIVLAVAFFMTLLTESAFTRSVGAGVTSELLDRRWFAIRLSTWLGEPDRVALGARLITARGPGGLREIARVAGWAERDVEDLAAATREETALIAYFESMDVGSRAILVKKTRPSDVLSYLQEPSHFSELVENLSLAKGPRPPFSAPQLKRLVDGRAARETELAALSADFGAGIRRFREDVEKTLGIEIAALKDLLLSGSEERRKALYALLASHGFEDTKEGLTRVKEGLARTALYERVREEFETERATVAWHHAFLDDPRTEAKLLRARDPRVPAILGGRFSHEELLGVARDLSHEASLLAAEKAVGERVVERQGQAALISGRQTFLMAISFIVCMIGITNAMLMAIAERFREIATMKCIGATDRFILHQFLMEAAIQGLAGGAAGTLIGGALSAAKCAFIFGAISFAYVPTLALLECAGICVVTGVLLSTLASIYPSWSASRMAPMDAMRIE